MCFSAEGDAIDMIKQDMTKISGDPNSELSETVCLSGDCCHVFVKITILQSRADIFHPFKFLFVPYVPESEPTPDKGSISSPDDQLSPSMNPFDGLKSEDEEEETVMVSIPEVAEEEGDEEVDEAELEAFLDGQLADGLIFLQDQEQKQEPKTFCELPSKGEEALRTCRINSKDSLLNR